MCPCHCIGTQQDTTIQTNTHPQWQPISVLKNFFSHSKPLSYSPPPVCIDKNKESQSLREIWNIFVVIQRPTNICCCELRRLLQHNSDFIFGLFLVTGTSCIIWSTNPKIKLDVFLVFFNGFFACKLSVFLKDGSSAAYHASSKGPFVFKVIDKIAGFFSKKGPA